jgi:NitT/TauT family transport system permease protein
MSPTARDRCLSLAAPAILLIAWEACVRLGWLDPRFFPAPSQIAEACVQLVKGGQLWGHIGISLWRIVAGFLLGAVPGVVAGLLMGMSRTLRALLDPLVSAVYALPKIAILPLVMLVFGIGELSKVILVAIATFTLVLINAMAGVRGLDPILVEAARSFGAGRREIFWHVILPGALPVIFAGLRLGLGVSLVVIIAAEFVAAKSGIGYLIWFSWSTLVTEDMFVGLGVIALLGVGFTEGLKHLERLLIPWEREILVEHPERSTPDEAL